MKDSKKEQEYLDSKKEQEYLMVDDTENLNDEEYGRLLSNCLKKGSVSEEMLSDHDRDLLSRFGSR